MEDADRQMAGGATPGMEPRSLGLKLNREKLRLFWRVWNTDTMTYINIYNIYNIYHMIWTYVESLGVNSRTLILLEDLTVGRSLPSTCHGNRCGAEKLGSCCHQMLPSQPPGPHGSCWKIHQRSCFCVSWSRARFSLCRRAGGIPPGIWRIRSQYLGHLSRKNCGGQLG